MPFFANPLGFLALVAIPAILLLHFFQRKSQSIRTSTLFLLEPLSPASAQGRRLERLRNSVPLWLQLLAVLLVTWLLVEPRWIRPGAVQPVVIVVDSTISLQVFREQMQRALERNTAELERASARTEWQLLESDPNRPPLYSGNNRQKLLQALENWQPHLGRHDPTPQLAAAQNLLGGKGMLVFVSDRRQPIPSGVHLLAVGHPFDECGFVGFSPQGDQWRALIQNHSSTAQKRRWWMEFAGQKTAAQEIVLAADQTLEIKGEFPPGSNRAELFLDPDAFALNDRLPFVRPVPKPLAVVGETEIAGLGDFFHQFKASLENVAPVGPVADLELAIYSPGAPSWPETSAIVFVADDVPATTVPSGHVVATSGSLAAELNWSGLLTGASAGVPAQPGDETLVWQGDRPLIFLRQSGTKRWLVVNFDLRTSNAAKLPAFVLLLHRFAKEIRSARVAPESRNFELNEWLQLATDPQLPAPVMEGSAEPVLRAPAEPRFFRVTQGKLELLNGAAHFADARAADFRPAGSVDEMRGAIGEARKNHSEADLLAPVWMLLLGLAMIGSWLWRS